MLLWLAQAPGLDFGRVLLFNVLLGLFVLLVPTLLLGAALPMAIGFLTRELGQVGADVGGAYLVNTGGAILGSVLTGFVFIPLLGTERTLLSGALANLTVVLLGLLLFAHNLHQRVLGAIAVAVLAAVSLL